jgi:protein-S-isoprenylcysteine O-methyltransferase Ste14
MINYLTHNLFETLLVFIWVIFIVYWIISSKRVKETKHFKKVLWGGFTARFLIVLLVIVLWIVPFFAQRLFELAQIFKVTGILVCIAGLSFSIWARKTLGKNWSANPHETKKDHDLITDGPYKYVRHPIYSGEILALIGTFFATGRLNIFIFFTVFTFGVYMRSRIEDSVMANEFGDKYLEYKEKVGGIIPRVNK